MSRRQKRRIVFVAMASVLLYSSLYFCLRPLGKANSWKIPFTNSVLMSFPAFPLDSGIRVVGPPLSPRSIADGMFLPLRKVDELLTGESIQFSAFTLFDMDNRFTVGKFIQF